MSKNETAFAAAFAKAGIATAAKAPKAPAKAAKAPAKAPKAPAAPKALVITKVHVSALVATMSAAAIQVSSATGVFLSTANAAGKMPAFKALTEADYDKFVGPVMREAATEAWGASKSAPVYAALCKPLFMAGAHGIALGAVANWTKAADAARKALVKAGHIAAKAQGRKAAAPGSKAPAKAPAAPVTAGKADNPAQGDSAAAAAAKAKAPAPKVFNRAETEAALAIALGKRADYAPVLMSLILEEPAKLIAWVDSLTA